jgi:hypothetical protein
MNGDHLTGAAGNLAVACLINHIRVIGFSANLTQLK